MKNMKTLILKSALVSLLLGHGTAAFAQAAPAPVPVPAAVEALQAAQTRSEAASNGSTSEGLEAGASSAFHGLGASSQVQIYLPGYNYAPAPRENLIFTKPERSENKPVPALSDMGDSQMRKAHYSREIGGFTLGDTAGHILTSLTAAAGCALAGWFLIGGAAATVGLGLAGLAVGLGLAAVFIGLFKGTSAASPRRDGFDEKVSF